MSTTQPIIQELDRHAKTMRGMVEKLQQAILDLPDNPRIQRRSANCFTMRLSDVGRNLSPEHHDFKAQYRAIIEALEKAQPDQIINRLIWIIAEERIAIPGSNPKAWINLHEDVIASLKKLAGIERTFWTSNAQWPKGTCSCLDPADQTSDIHSSKSAADSVCRRLQEMGFGGNSKEFPIRTWTEPKAIFS